MKILAALDQTGGLREPVEFSKSAVATYDPCALRRVLDNLALTAGVHLLFHAEAENVVAHQGLVREVHIRAAGTRRRLRPRFIIDATGDASLVTLAGLPVVEERMLQPVSLMFRLGGVDVARVQALGAKELYRLLEEALSPGEFRLPRLDATIVPLPLPGQVGVTMSRLPALERTRAEDLTWGELESRARAEECLRLLRTSIPGFEGAYLVEVSPQVGVRESRRILGEYVLNEEDISEGRKFPDAIACGAWGMEVAKGDKVRMRWLRAGRFYQIPFRCLLPMGSQNVLAAGRCISVTPVAQTSTRAMATSMAVGQAAGLAATHAVDWRRPFTELPVDVLQADLVKEGLFLPLGTPNR